MRAVGALLVAVFVQGVGASAVLPLLPLFLRSNGTSNTEVGAVMASFFFAGVLTQYVAGHATDRAGHRPVIVGGLCVYAAASLGFIADVGSGGYVALRATQGVGAGAVQVAALALVGLVVPVERRGRAFSAVFAAQLLGMAVGPIAGGAAGVGQLKWLFVATAVATLAAAVPVVVGTGQVAAAGTEPADRQVRLVVSRGLVGVALVGVATGLAAGVYEACWSLLLDARGAAAWQIGLSWTLFAVPFAAFSPVAGRLADRLDRKRLTIFAVVGASAFAAGYGFIPTVAVLVGLGAVEAITIAVALPAAQSLLSQTAPAAALGRAQGLFTTAETGSIGVAAAVSGALFGVAHWLPFVAAGVVGTVLVLPMAVLWRELPGRVTGDGDPVAPGPAEAVAVGATSTA